jgi:hypothetical protein
MIKRHRSSELGHAFCRWFLHDHFDIAYFAHMEHVLNKETHKAFNGLRIERVASGDTPDYFCAKNVNKIFLAEAKARYTSVSFASREFVGWRSQFDTVVVKDTAGQLRKVKGLIVATRFCTEANRPSLKTTLYCEDPETSGIAPLGAEEARQIGRAIIATHYAGIAIKLRQDVLASSLLYGFVTPAEIGFPVTVWAMQHGPLKGKRFVGGLYPSSNGQTPFRQLGNGQVVFEPTASLRLDLGKGTFFGVEEKIFGQVADFSRSERTHAPSIAQFEQTEPFYSGISILRDGSIIGPIEFFAPVEQRFF